MTDGALTTDWAVVDETAGGIGWQADPDELMQRTSHALRTDAGVWLIDPVDVPTLDEFLTRFETIRGVAVLMDRHRRDAATIASRYDRPVTVPSGFERTATGIDREVEFVTERLPDTNYELIPVVKNRLWKEVAVCNGETLVVPEAVGTAPYFATSSNAVGVHPLLRPFPPRESLGKLSPEQIRFGHGRGIHDGATNAINNALGRARWSAPRLYAESVNHLIFG